MIFDVVLADPPWDFEYWEEKTASLRGSGKAHYPTMKVDQICALPVGSLVAPNCALFLWTVWPLLDQAWKVMEAWGFTYRTAAFVWVKARRSGFGFFTGMGYYTRSNTEVCLLAVKGRMAVAAHDVAQLIYSPVQSHSKKPDDLYDKIERLYPGRRYVELFARQTRPGWERWGNEVPSTITFGTGVSG